MPLFNRENVTAFVLTFIFVNMAAHIASEHGADLTSLPGFLVIGIVSGGVFAALNIWFLAMSRSSKTTAYTMTIESAAEPHIDVVGGKPGTYEVDETQRADGSWKYVIRTNGGSSR